MLPSDLSVRNKIAAARAMICQGSKARAPYLAGAIYGLVPRELPGLGTMGVSKHAVLYYDPEVVVKWSIEEIAATLEHEVGHLMRRHHQRAEALGIKVEPGQQVSEELKRKAKLINIAQDICINEGLREGGRTMPGFWWYPETANQAPNLVMEERYRLLLERDERERKAGGGGPEMEVRPCGSCSGNPLPGEPATPPSGARSEADVERIRKTVAKAVQDHARKHGAGSVASTWQVWAGDELAPSKVPWQTLLARAIRSAVAYRTGDVDLVWTEPSRLQGGIGWGPGLPILPATLAPVPDTAVIVDDSGSMTCDNNKPLRAAISEVAGVLKSLGSEVTVGVCDAEVQGLKIVQQIDQVTAMLTGGGGTDMRPAFAAMLARPRKPEVIVCITDGLLGGGHPDGEPPGVKVVWVLVGDQKTDPCDWGTKIWVDDDGVRTEAP